MVAYWFWLVLGVGSGVAVIPQAYNKVDCEYAAKEAQKSGYAVAFCVPAKR